VIVHEIASKKITPLLKGLLTHELYERGFSQRRIALILSITQPQVYKYLARSKEYFLAEFSRMGFDSERVKCYVEALVELLVKGYSEKYVVLINSIVHEMALDYACTAYKLPETLCREKKFADPHIEYYKAWLDKITSLPGLHSIIPEVGSNIVYASSKPEKIVDVIGLTGRIIRADGKVGVAGEPIYGGSKHLSRVLILAAKYDPDKRVAMNISHNINPDILADKWVVKYTGPHSSLEEFWHSLENALASKPDVVIDLGGYGLEPVTYLITRSFKDLELILAAILGLKL